MRQSLDIVFSLVAHTGAETLENFNNASAGALPLDKLKGKWR